MTLDAVASGSPYVGYVYSYPHKTAHRPLEPALPLARVWAEEPKEGLFGYVHIPFCEMRCGFCNLFTTTDARRGQVTAYLGALERQAAAVAEALGAWRFARMAVGGGTPTYLEPDELERLFRGLQDNLRLSPEGRLASVETSPATATAERLAVLKAWGVHRVSIGVQSFFADETDALYRPQRAAEVEAALQRIRDAGFRCLNIDLMYGGAGQTPARWQASLDAALAWAPEELYLYPLYVRPLTGLGRRGWSWDDQRLDAYRRGRERLLAAGYEQVSMRMFRRPGGDAQDGLPYRCDQDGMIGLGCGARSYTRRLHYAWPYAVARAAVRSLIEDYSGRTRADFALAHHGIALTDEEILRRYVLLSLLQVRGLERAEAKARFGRDPMALLPELEQLAARGLVLATDDRLALTERGLERSDAIGPWLFSQAVRENMETFTWT
ncbi:MAG: STM4012 family radical SAM protein [Myxococcales bacterium]|nr:STM4012 family radical SAM protein [Myxococcales bacterium]